MSNQNREQPKKLPQEIYQRRRVAALVILVLVVLLLIWAASALFGGSDEASAPAPSSAAQDTAASKSTASEQPQTEQPEGEESAAARESEAAEETTSASAAAKPAGGKETCELGDLRITASLAKENVPAGELPEFYMKVQNPTAADCTIDLDEQQLRFEVYDMRSNERIWSDTDCYAAVETGEQKFAAGADRAFAAEWSRKGSQPGKCSNRPETPAGSYYVHAVIGDNPSPAAPFELG